MPELHRQFDGMSLVSATVAASDPSLLRAQEPFPRTDDLLRTEFPEPLQQIKEQFASQGNWAGELRHICANGSRITVSTRWVAERDARGNIASILESNRDISESKRAQEAQGRLAAIVEFSEDAIIAKNLDGIIVNWNKAAERIFGYAAEEAIGQHITLIIPPTVLAKRPIFSRPSDGRRALIISKPSANERTELYWTFP
jgi:PAS domain-containing protein